MPTSNFDAKTAFQQAALPSLSIRNALVVNEGQIQEANIFIKDGLIYNIDSHSRLRIADHTLDLKGSHVLPGLIDDQVHFREPGLTHKADIRTESRAAVAGGTTSFMEMPNTAPPTLSQALLEAKYERAAQVSLANYSFYMGVGHHNMQEALTIDPNRVCGLKIFMGSSTGDMLVDDDEVLTTMFRDAPCLIATHCEDEETIRKNLEEVQAEFGNEIPPEMHPVIRDAVACKLSSAKAVALAKRYNTRLHVLHISTEDELVLFDDPRPRAEKRITAEVCVHHLWFDADDYMRLGNQIKCNPAIKSPHHKVALLAALNAGRLDVLATDHAPHTWDEKQRPYLQAPSGLPLVQHALPMLLDFAHRGKLDLPTIADRGAHAVADIFQIDRRGYLREGYHADIAIVDTKAKATVLPQTLHYKCGWSPLAGQVLHGVVSHTIVSGHLAFAEGRFYEAKMGERLAFNRY